MDSNPFSPYSDAKIVMDSNPLSPYSDAKIVMIKFPLILDIIETIAWELQFNSHTWCSYQDMLITGCYITMDIKKTHRKLKDRLLSCSTSPKMHVIFKFLQILETTMFLYPCSRTCEIMRLQKPLPTRLTLINDVLYLLMYFSDDVSIRDYNKSHAYEL